MTAYRINGSDFLLQPTTGKWMPRQPLGIDGNGHTIYPALREFQLTWQTIDLASYNQLLTWFNGIGSTGTSVVDLPQFGASTYTFYSYTGCVLQEPVVEEYFMENELRASMFILGIRV